jgi:hypothetical protein
VPGNARILENHAALAFFYTSNRPWNPYRGNQALRARLEAVLEYLLKIQNSDGRLPSDQVAGQKPNLELAGTAFGVKFLGETLLMLEQSRRAGGPTIDPGLHQRVIAATRKAIDVCLTFTGFFVSATRYSNQYSGFWGGTLAFLSAHPDESLRQRFVARIEKLADKENPDYIEWGGKIPFLMSSPAGYHWEHSGADWGYTFSTQYPNVRHVWNHARGTKLMDSILAMEKPWVDWLSYNAVREPSSGNFTLNRAIQSRIIQTGGFDLQELTLAESIPLARAFARTRDEHNAYIQKGRQDVINGWLNARKTVTSYAPHAFADRIDRFEWRPTAAERNAAIANLPYLARDRFVHQRADDRINVTFVRRPSYYAAFNAGREIIMYGSPGIQRYGLGLLWNPQMGTVLQTPSGDVAPWGTSRENATPFEARSLAPTLKINGQAIVKQSGARDLPNGETGVTSFEYGLFDEGQKTVTFNADRINVSVRLTGVFTEQMVLLTREGDNLAILPGVIRLTRGGRIFEIAYPAGVTVTQRPAGGWPPPSFTATRIILKATDSLDYSLSFK